MGSGCCRRSVEENEKLVNCFPNSSDCVLNLFYDPPAEQSSVFGLSGIENLGSTSYISAVTQCLLHCQPLADYFLFFLDDSGNSKSKSSHELISILESFMACQWQSSYKCIVPNSLVEWTAVHFGNRTQNIAQEFLAIVLETLHDTMRTEIELKIKNKRVRQEFEAAKAWGSYISKNKSVIADLFHGMLKSIVTCKTCQRETCSFEIFNCLKLEIPKNGEMSLENCLKTFCEPKELKNCPACNSSTATQRFEIWKLPLVIVFALKRVYTKRKSLHKNKNKINCDIYRLDLSSFVRGNCDFTPIYNLFAVVDHQGSIQKEHYTTSVLHRHSFNWIHFDDENMRYIEHFTVLNQNNHLLMYQNATVPILYRKTYTNTNSQRHVEEGAEIY